MGLCRVQGLWIVNGLIVLSMFGLLYLIELNIVQFPKIGFYCDDPKIAYKFNGDTITATYLFASTLIAPLLLINIVEWWLARRAVAFKLAFKWYGQFLFGFLFLVFIIETAKSVVSEPRPHFLDTCRPDKAINCTSGYFTEYSCTNMEVKAYLIKDSSRSFPSGHSAIGFYFSMFLIVYLQHRIPDTKYFVVPWLQSLCFLWGLLCALTRITDRRHHWWDVLVGSATGTVIAAYAVKRLCNNFQCHVVSSENSSEDSVSSGKVFSSRRLLSSTSSYSPPEEKDVRTMS